MNIYITYWNSEEKKVEDRYYKTDFIAHTTAKLIQRFFNKKLKFFSVSKLLQIVMDIPNVNWSYYDKH